MQSSWPRRWTLDIAVHKRDGTRRIQKSYCRSRKQVLDGSKYGSEPGPYELLPSEAHEDEVVEPACHTDTKRP